MAELYQARSTIGDDDLLPYFTCDSCFSQWDAAEVADTDKCPFCGVVWDSREDK